MSRHTTGIELLERERELGLLAESVERARRSEGTLVLVEGPAGIGTSTLLDRGRELALRTGVRVLSARGGELEREFPYGVVRQLFEPALRAMSARRRRELFAGAAALAVPVIEAAGTDVRAAPCVIDNDQQRFARRHVRRQPVQPMQHGKRVAVSPHQAGPDGNIWSTDQGTTKAIGRITPSGVITEFSTGLTLHATLAGSTDSSTVSVSRSSDNSKQGGTLTTGQSAAFA